MTKTKQKVKLFHLGFVYIDSLFWKLLLPWWTESILAYLCELNRVVFPVDWMYLLVALFCLENKISLSSYGKNKTYALIVFWYK